MPTSLQASTFAPSLTVNDVAASIRFYTEALGFTIEHEWKEGEEVQGAMLRAGAAHIGIGKDDFAKGRDRVKGTGMSLYVETPQDIAELAEQAKTAGASLDSGPGPLPWGPMGFSVKDPDGFRITIANPSSAGN